MKIGQYVNISPYLTHLSEWVMGQVIEIFCETSKEKPEEIQN